LTNVRPDTVHEDGQTGHDKANSRLLLFFPENA